MRHISMVQSCTSETNCTSSETNLPFCLKKKSAQPRKAIVLVRKGSLRKGCSIVPQILHLKSAWPRTWLWLQAFPVKHKSIFHIMGRLSKVREGWWCGCCVTWEVMRRCRERSHRSTAASCKSSSAQKIWRSDSRFIPGHTRAGFSFRPMVLEYFQIQPLHPAKAFKFYVIIVTFQQ